MEDHGNGSPMMARHRACFSFEAPYFLALIPQGWYGRDGVGVRLLNDSIPSPGIRVGF